MTSETQTKSMDKITQQIIEGETLMAPSLESRLDNILGGIQALWHVAKEVNDGMDREALMFIHDALLENIRAVRAACYKCEHPVKNIHAVQCPTMYHQQREG